MQTANWKSNRRWTQIKADKPTANGHEIKNLQHNADSFANWASLEPAAKTVFFHDNVSDINQLVARLEPFSVQTEKIKGAALDVFDKEPLPPNHPFRYLPNVLATPHIGYVTEYTFADAFQQIVENIAAWLNGKPQRVIG
jgi:D-isomer specific 2-hydroxyacid dehydrogenase-like protein